MTLVCMCMTLV